MKLLGFGQLVHSGPDFTVLILMESILLIALAASVEVSVFKVSQVGF